MELILPVLSTTISYFFLAYFIYIISGRKRQLTQGFLYVLMGVMIYQNVIRPWSLLSTPQLIYAMIASIAPPLLSLLLLRYLMGDFRFGGFKFKQTKLKAFKERKDTIKFQMTFVYLTFIFPVIFIALAFLILESFLFYATILLSIGVFIYGIYAYLKLRHIKKEVLILLIGKDKESIYVQDVMANSNHIDIKTYFNDERYIIDHLGYIDLKDEKMTSRHHLYWIGTSDKVLVDESSWKKIDHLPYQKDLVSFEKYHYIYAVYDIKGHDIKQVQFKRIK